MFKRGARTVYSPSDLSRFMESRFASWMDRFALEHPDEVRAEEPDEARELVFRKGREHEAAVLERFRDAGREVVEIDPGRDRRAETLAAMRDGPELIYQAQLARDDLEGRADFLVRVDGASRLGSYHYEPLEAKLGKRPKPAGIVQLCCYAEMLEAAQGVLPRQIHVICGTGEQATLRLADHVYLYRELKRDFLRLMAEFGPRNRPVPQLGEEHREWEAEAAELLEQLDHLSRVANIRSSQIKKLEAAGIATMTGLARSKRRRVPRLDTAVFERLRAQARLQLDSAGRERPLFEIPAPDPADPRRGLALLPPPSPLDVYFDMEGYPLGARPLEYLFGAMVLEQGERRFRDWWAHDAQQERQAFEQFIDWTLERHRRDPGMHVYHYNHYETTALKRLMGRHGTREHELDRLLRHEVFVDLYPIVRDGVRVGEPRYSIKNLERLFREGRQGAVGTAVDSMVHYERWLDADEPPDWRESGTLSEIRDYNRDDCESTLLLAEWLRERQREHGIAWCGPAKDDDGESNGDVPAAPAVAVSLLRRAETDAAAPHDALLGQLVEFHRREDRPMWWAMFERHAMTEEELVEDLNCLGGLRRADDPPTPAPDAALLSYRFDPEQHTKLQPGGECYFAHDLGVRVSIEELDLDRGRVRLRLRSGVLAALGSPPDRLSLIPNEYVRSHTISRSIQEIAQRRLEEHPLPAALLDFLDRRPPRISGHDRGPLARAGEDPVDAALRLVPAMDGTTLSIQGPPGSGKTTTAARVILDLLDRGRRVGITSNGHKAIVNLLGKCAELRDGRLACLKAGGDPDDPFFRRCRGARYVGTARDAAGLVDRCALIAGTAWLFSRGELHDRFDYLFVDEAGQVSVANLTGMSRAARNLVLVGDQMQLPQPVQGAHPGDSGLSTLEYLLGDWPTIPPELGLFLDRTYRLHPALCDFVSDAFYEGRLSPAPRVENRRVVARDNPGGPEAGVAFLPVEHEGNTQASAEEVEQVRRLVAALLEREHTGLDGEPLGPLRPREILVVAPYNLQVRKLRQRLPAGVRVGTVDKFQGQEAPVVIVSMCASEGHGSPRGLEFLLNPNRLNVALSRAQSLSIVVGHPGLARTRCLTVEQMKLVNLFCRIARQRS